jgi:hypothetical protein
MTSSYTTNKRLEKPANGDYVNTWSSPVNNDWDAIDAAFGGTASINAVGASGTVVLTFSQYRPPNMSITGALTANVNYQIPSGVGGIWSVYNGTSGAYTITISSGGGGTSQVVTQGTRLLIVCDGTNVAIADTTLNAANANTFTGKQSFTGTTTNLAEVLTNAAEVITVSATAATGTINYDITTQSVLYYTNNATANWTVNLRANGSNTLASVLSIGQCLTVAFMAKQGSPAYYNNSVQVDGTTTGVTTLWQGGVAPTTGNINGVDVYTYTVIKTGSAAYTVLASRNQFA